jgi:amidohydrolase
MNKIISILVIISVSIASLSASGKKPFYKALILEKVKEIDPYVRSIRGYIHEHPEKSLQEFETSKFLKAEVEKLGLKVYPSSPTGFYTILETGRPGKTIALRTDIDALPVKENPFNLKQTKRWISKNDGVAHVCGHDGHIAVSLGTLKILNDLKDRLKGRIIFIFEDAEEIAGGVDNMIKALSEYRIDAIYGNHVNAAIPVGELSITEGPVMAGAAGIGFDVIGRGGHASRPDQSINPVYAAAHILTGISVAWNNQIDITKTVTLGITQIHGGEASNIFPNSVFIGGTLRFFDRAAGEQAVEVFKRVASSVAEAHNAQVKFSEESKVSMEPVVNDSSLASIAREVAGELFPGHIISGDQMYGCEPFSRYRSIAPILYIFIGIANDELGSGAAHHNDKFDIDEDALQYGVGAMVGFAIKMTEQ